MCGVIILEVLTLARRPRNPSPVFRIRFSAMPPLRPPQPLLSTKGTTTRCHKHRCEPAIQHQIMIALLRGHAQVLLKEDVEDEPAKVLHVLASLVFFFLCVQP